MQDEQRLLGCILTGHIHVVQSHVAITVICDDRVRSQLCQTSMGTLDPHLPHTLRLRQQTQLSNVPTCILIENEHFLIPRCLA